MSTASGQTGLEALTSDECLQLLRAGSVGRIAVVPDIDEAPIVVPVNYRLVEPGGIRWIALRTRPGNVIERAAKRAAFEIDGIDHVREVGWSVLVRGVLHRIDPDAADFRHRFDPEPWVLTERDRWLAIEPFAISGRRVQRAEPEWTFSLHAYL